MATENLNLETMTDEQIQALINKLAEEKPKEKAPAIVPQKIQFKLPDGEVLEGTQEEINQQLAYRLQEAHLRSQSNSNGQPTNTNTTVVDKVNWNYDEFVNKFRQDPDQGIAYMYKAKYGYNPTEVLPVIVEALKSLGAKVNQYEQNDFLSKHKDFKQTPKNQKAIQDLIQQGRATNVEDAFVIGKAYGMLELEEEKKVEPEKPKPQPIEVPKGFPDIPGLDFRTSTPFDPTNPNLAPPPLIGQNGGGGDFSYRDLETRLKDVDNNELRSFVHQMESSLRRGV